MLIVASNSLTVSNVNDGTITHTAYAWSADGTDGFTTVYPEENLLLNTGLNNLPKYWTASNGIVSGTFNGHNVFYSDATKLTNDFNEVLRQTIYDPALTTNRVLPSHWYTLSFYAKGVGKMNTYVYANVVDTSAGSYIDGVALGYANPDGSCNWDLTDGWTRHTYTFKSKSNFPASGVQNVLWRLFKGNEGYICMPKLDEGTLATPYMPSASEATTDDYPSYLGQYTDYTEADSDDPTKYEWALVKGANGADGQSVWSYLYNRGANRLGSYWSDLKPAPTTDNPPKVGDTVIDLIGNMYQITNVVVGTAVQGGGTFDYGSLITSIKGNDGIAGKDGVGVKATAITYAQSTSGTTPPTTGWTAGVPTLIKGQYLWTKTVWTYTDSSTETGYTVSYNAKDGNTGSDGRAGKDGTGIKSTVIEYVGAVSGTSKPISGWSTTIPTVPAGQYLWTRTTWQYTDGTSEQGFTNALMGRTGATGADGKDGLGIKSTIITYQLSSNGTATPTGTWSTTVPTLVKGQYLWTRTTLIYTDNTNEHVYSVSYVAKDGNNGTDGVAGKDGVGIKSTTITYQSGTSGTVQPTGAWVSNPPSVTGGNYLWTRTVWSYTDGTNETGYSIAKAGEKGDQGLRGLQGADGKDGVAGKDGVGIKSTAVTYQASTSGTTAPTGTWIASPTASAGQYQWTRTVWTYTDGTTEVGYSVGHIGVDGATGKDGIAGKDGVGIKSTTITYAVSASGTSAPTSGWVSTPPSATAGQFVWTRTIWTYTDNTTETGYSVGKIGEKGADGANGAPGKPGADGRTPYFHQAWADSQDGNINFSVDDPTNRGYLGTYTDFTQADSTDPTKYFWVELVGALSIGGRNYLLDTNTPWQIQGSGGVNQSSAMKWLFTFGTIKQAPFKDGEYVTVSFDYISTGTGTYGTILSQFNEAPWGQFKGAGDAMKDNGHVVYTVQWKSDWTTSGTATGIQIRLDNVATTRTVTVYNMQFERGNKDTDWKQAPEDTQGQIDKVNNGLGHVEGLYNSILTPIASITAPTNPKTDQQWWVLDANGKTVGFKIWNGKTWADAQIQQSAMNIGTLNGNTINGATINSSEYNVAYDETKENTGRVFGPYFKGTQVIKGGSYLSDYTVKGTTQTGFNHITPDGITTGVDDANGRMVNQATLGRGYLVLSEQGKTGVITGDLNAQDSYRNSTDSVAWLGGWGDWGNGNGLIHVVRNGRLVTLSGYPHHNNTTEMGNVFQLPAWAKPATGTNISTVSYNSGVGNATACRIFINNNGLAIITGGQRGGYVVIGASYVGKDM